MGAADTSGVVTKGYTTDVVSSRGSYLSASLDISRVLLGKDISSSCVGRVKVALMVGSYGMLSSESEESLKGTTSSSATRMVALLDSFSSTSSRCSKKSSVLN